MFSILLNTRVLLGALIIAGAAAAISTGATGAFFSDTETSTGNTFAAGAIDLKVDNDSYYNLNRCVNLGDEQNPNWQWQGQAAYPTGPCTTSWTLDDLPGHLFFNFLDLKPSDFGEDTISLHVQNDAWACMNISLTSNDDNSSTEPELGDGDTEDVEEDVWDGELASAIQMFWWADDGDNVYEEGENGLMESVETLYNMATTSPFAIALADSAQNVWNPGFAPGPMLAQNDVYYIGKAWCLGTLQMTALPEGEGGPQERPGFVNCNGIDLSNITQTDGATLDITFTADQARNNPDFLCEVPDEQRECEFSEEFAIAFHDVDQGTRKNGTAILADRTDPNDALGAPQSTGTVYDNPVVAGSFFSLGFKGTPAAVPGGSIVLEFPGNIVDGPGADLKLWEVTGGSNYPDEEVRVEVSNSLAGPWTVVASNAIRDEEIDIAPVASAKYVRITDVSPPGPFEATADGFDLDAVQALNCLIPVE